MSLEWVDLERIQRDLRTLGELHVRSLNSYYVARDFGFSHLQRKADWEASRASSDTCIVSLIRSGRWNDFEELVAQSEPRRRRSKKNLLTGFVRRLLRKGNWPTKIKSAGLPKGNPFTLAFALEAMRHAIGSLGDKEKLSVEHKVTPWVDEAVRCLRGALRSHTRPEDRPKKLKDQNPDAWAEIGAAHVPHSRPTTFLTQLVLRALLSDGKGGVLRAKKVLGAGLYRAVVEWSWRQVLYELSLLKTPDNRASDPLALAYAVIIFATCKDESEFTLDESRVISEALAAFFKSQLENGGWPRSRPLHFYPKIGNAYCFDFEVLTQLLQCGQLTSRLLGHLPDLARALQRVKDTAQPIDGVGKCWSSSHHPHLPNAESWSTASVYHFIYNLDRLFAEAIRQYAFKHVGCEYKPPEADAPSAQKRRNLFADFLDSRIRLDDGAQSLVETFRERFLEPIVNERDRVVRGQSMKHAPVSAILFGPPGTAKTTLAKYVARYLGWPLLSIDPSHVVKQGLDAVQAESNLLFSMLSSVEQTVVFLDEFDELMRARSSETADIRSRFLTTAMLPKLASVNASRRAVFVLATNYFSEFDFAIRRPGRFDVAAQIMPPTWSEKQELLGAKARQRIKKAIKSVRNPLVRGDKAKWTDILEALTFDEFKALKKRVEQLPNSNPQKIRELLERVWQRATLNQRLSKDDEETWSKRCESEQNQSRFPDAKSLMQGAAR